MYCIAAQVVDGTASENNNQKLEIHVTIPLLTKPTYNGLPSVGLKQEELSMGMTVLGTICICKSSEVFVT